MVNLLRVLLDIGWFILSILTLIAPALINGYPLVYSDTGTYIAHGFNGNVPYDRPIMYCLFVRHISMATSLWFVILLQAIIVWFIINFTCRHFLKLKNYHAVCFFIIVFLSCTTGMANYTSQIMADIFSGILILSLGLLLTLQDLKLFYRIILSILVIFSNMAHSSNLLVSTTILVLSLLLMLFIRKKIPSFFFSRSVYIAVLIASSWLLIPYLNYKSGAGFVVSRAPNVFIMARLSESGVLKKYLDDNCKGKSTDLCNSKNTLPEKSWQYLWSDKSPLYAGGCVPPDGYSLICWPIKNKEYTPILGDIFSNTRYLFPYLSFASKESFLQLLSFKTEPLDPMMEGSPVIGNIKWRFEPEYNQYIHTRQSVRAFTYETINGIQAIVMKICLLVLLIYLLVPKLRDSSWSWKMIIFVAAMGLLMNATVCATFSMVADRFQGRIIWLLPFLTIGMVLRHLYKPDGKKI